MNDKERINQINLYERAFRKRNTITDKNRAELVYDALGLDSDKIYQYEIRTRSKLIAIDKVKRTDKEGFKKAVEEYQKINRDAVSYILDNSCLTSIKDLRRPNLIDLLIKRNPVLVAHNQHFESLNECLRLLERNPELKEKYDEELRQINLNYQIVKMLHKALKEKDNQQYQDINEIIAERFEQLPRAININNSGLDVVVEGCLRREAYLVDTHPNYDIIKAEVYHPSVFIAKAILSKAMNQFD